MSRPEATSNSRSAGYVLALLVLGSTVYFLIYTATISANMVHLAWFFHAPMIEHYFEGRQRFSDLTVPFAEHGMFGYNLLLLINVIFFRLNTLFDSYLNVAIVAAVATITAVAYARTFPATRHPWLMPVLFGPVAFALFSVTQGSSGAMETQVRLGSLAFMVVSFVVDRALFASAKSPGAMTLLAGVALVVGATLLFGTFYSFAWFPGLVAMCLYAAIVRRGTRIYGGGIIATLLLAIPLYFWFYDLKLPANPARIGLMERTTFLVQSMLATLSSASVGRTLWEVKIISDRMLLLNGLFVFAAYGYALWLWVRRGVVRVTWLPVLMIASSVGVGLLVAIGRASLLDWSWGTSYWYAVHTKFGLAGSLWIFGHVIAHSRRESAPSAGRPRVQLPTAAACSVVIALLCAPLAFANYVEWQYAPEARGWLESKVRYAFAGTPMPLDETGRTPFHATPEETMEGMRVFRRYRLTFFANFPPITDRYEPDILVHGETTRAARLRPGWHQLEGSQRWTARQSEILFRTGPRGTVTVSGYMPGFLAPNMLTLLIDGKEIGAKLVAEGFFSVSGAGPPETDVALLIRTSNHVVPKDRGFSGDQRELGAIIKNIETH